MRQFQPINKINKFKKIISLFQKKKDKKTIDLILTIYE